MVVAAPAPGETIEGDWTADVNARLAVLEGGAWTALVLINTWTAGATAPSVRKVGPTNVQISGQFGIGATKADNTQITTIPVGFRPLHDLDVLLSANATVAGGQNPHLFIVAATGIVTCWGVSAAGSASCNVIYPTNL